MITLTARVYIFVGVVISATVEVAVARPIKTNAQPRVKTVELAGVGIAVGERVVGVRLTVRAVL